MRDNSAERVYRGDGQFHYAHLKPIKGAWKVPEPYIASPTLVEAVNAALYLRRPLLLEGEPGCGKTRLAYAVAYELGYPLFECYISSNIRAQDLLYEYDALGRLYDLEERKAIRLYDLEERKATGQGSIIGGDNDSSLSRREYIAYGKLGEAIKQSDEEDKPSVVLIDEIDKADIDFANDLLREIDRLKFEVKELKEVKGGKNKGQADKTEFDAFKGKGLKERRHSLPFIIITSNREKELPKPFLRRCLFYYIEFPKELMEKIIQSHRDEFENVDFADLTPLSSIALQRFWELRKNKFWRKIVGTSELLDWLKVLERDQITAEELEGIPLTKLPHLETLIKTQSDYTSLKQITAQQ